MSLVFLAHKTVVNSTHKSDAEVNLFILEASPFQAFLVVQKPEDVTGDSQSEISAGVGAGT